MGFSPMLSWQRKSRGERRVGDTGLESITVSSGKTQVPPQGGAESGALGNGFEPGPREVAAAWGTLPADAKTAILGIVRATAGEAAGTLEAKR